MNRNRIRICGRNRSPRRPLRSRVGEQRPQQRRRERVSIACVADEARTTRRRHDAWCPNPAGTSGTGLRAAAPDRRPDAARTVSNRCVQRRTAVSESVALRDRAARRWRVTMSGTSPEGGRGFAAGYHRSPTAPSAREPAPPHGHVATREREFAFEHGRIERQPSRSARSTCLSATITGSPRAMSWSVKRKWLRDWRHRRRRRARRQSSPAWVP